MYTPTKYRARAAWAILVFFCWAGPAVAQSDERKRVVVVVEAAGKVEFAPPGEPPRWNAVQVGTKLYPGYQLRTGPNSRATVRLGSSALMSIGAEGQLQVFPEEKERTMFDFFKGVFYLFRRGEPGEYRTRTPTVAAVVFGTEFGIKVAENGATRLNLFNGSVQLTNEFGHIMMEGGDAAEVVPGEAPQPAPYLEAADEVQWRLYYPAVLYLGDLEIPAELLPELNVSMQAYREGDLRGALRLFQSEEIQNASVKIYHAALLLGVGEVGQVEEILSDVLEGEGVTDRQARIVTALR